ncbi:MAG: hypothetical protein DRJ41_01055 [Thermoprotei archaeon]|nr:MAG: hypothetical protein DRJ41_01055 [Thermoprotei archaeon]
MRDKWESLFSRGEFTSLGPDEEVLRFALLLKDRGLRRVLDLGCGACRHTIYLASEDFEVYGCDFSARALSICKERLGERGLLSHLTVCDMRMLGYVRDYFDAVICVAAIYHNTLDDIRRSVGEVYRVLRSGGLFLTNFLSRRTWKYGRGVKVEENTYLQDEAFERNVIHHYSDEEEIRELFKGFKVLELRLKERIVEGKLSSRWVVIAEKP